MQDSVSSAQWAIGDSRSAAQSDIDRDRLAGLSLRLSNAAAVAFYRQEDEDEWCIERGSWIVTGRANDARPAAIGVEATEGAAIACGPEARRNQFTLHGLLGWTLAAAVPMAACRAIMPDVSFDAEILFGWLLDAALAGSLVALAGLPIVPLCWILLAAPRRPLLRMVLSLLLLAGLPGGVWMFVELSGGPGFEETIPVLAGNVANGVITLMVIGACGYRLDRPRRPSAEEAKRREVASVEVRRPLSRFRFALTLAPLLSLATAVVCVAPYQLRQWRQAAIAADWARSGVRLSFDDAGKLRMLHGITPSLMSEDLLRRIVELKDLDYVNFAGAEIDDRQLAMLAPLTSLRSIHLSDCEITDNGLEQLAQFRNLEILNLTNTCITDAGLARLKALPKLSSLDLQLTDVTDAGLATLTELPRLSRVDVCLTAVTAAAAKRFIAARPSVLLEYGASDALLARQLMNRRTVTFGAGGIIQSRGIAVSPRPLKRLHAHGRYPFGAGIVTVTDAGLRSLASLTELQQLDLHDTAVTDGGVPLLSTLKALKTLDLRGTKVTEQGIADLARSLPECQIVR